MSTDHPAQRRRDRTVARAWLDARPGRLQHVLHHLYAQEPVLGALAELAALRTLPLDQRQAQGVAALLVGERYVRPAPGQEGQGQYDARGHMTLGPVTLTRKGLALLVDEATAIGETASQHSTKANS